MRLKRKTDKQDQMNKLDFWKKRKEKERICDNKNNRDDNDLHTEFNYYRVACCKHTVKSVTLYLPLSKESTSALESVCGFPARALRNSFGLPNM